MGLETRILPQLQQIVAWATDWSSDRDQPFPLYDPKAS